MRNKIRSHKDNERIKNFTRLLKELGLYSSWIKCRKEYIKLYGQEYDKELFYYASRLYSFVNMLEYGIINKIKMYEVISPVILHNTPSNILKNQKTLDSINNLLKKRFDGNK